MPTYIFKGRPDDVKQTWWIYAIDDWDARDQIARTLRIQAHDETLYTCKIDYTRRLPLDVILDCDGNATAVKRPMQLFED
ncbi:hypothetical protein [Beijerinckia sp. L45]|uniref:hypothetical protein n=1 Tax=Beijerinckia sp. L45 TaxID=1641855 RepID=UPI00131E8F53|nr:hypothetical protein [Beijerinckia sp. L45]